MKLFKDKRWSGSEEYFSGPSIIKVKDESVSVDYEFKSESGNFLGFGYDLPSDFMDTDEMYDYLFSTRDNNNSLWNKIMKFSRNEFSSPIVFLLSNNFVYYLPHGTRQIDDSVWIKESTLQGVIELVKQKDRHILYEIREKKNIDYENSHSLAIEDAKALLNANQIKALTSKPFYLESSITESVPGFFTPNKLKIKRIDYELESICINVDDDKNLKLKVYYCRRENIDTNGEDHEESSGWTETVFLTINDFGEIEKSTNQKDEETKYRLLKFN